MNLLVLTKEAHRDSVKAMIDCVRGQPERIEITSKLVFDGAGAQRAMRSEFYEILLMTVRDMPASYDEFEINSKSAWPVLRTAVRKRMGLLLTPDLSGIVMADEELRSYKKKRFIYTSPHELMRQLPLVYPGRLDCLAGAAASLAF